MVGIGGVLDRELPLVTLPVAGLRDDVAETERVVGRRFDPARDGALGAAGALDVCPDGVVVGPCRDDEIQRPEVHQVHPREPDLRQRARGQREPDPGGIVGTVVGDGADAELLAGRPSGSVGRSRRRRRRARQGVLRRERRGRLQSVAVGEPQRRAAVGPAVVVKLFREVPNVRHQRPVVLDESVQPRSALEEGRPVATELTQEHTEFRGRGGPHRRRQPPDLLAVLALGPPGVALVADQPRDRFAGRVPVEVVETGADVIGEPVGRLVVQIDAVERRVRGEPVDERERRGVESQIQPAVGQPEGVGPGRVLPEPVQPVGDPIRAGSRPVAQVVGDRCPSHGRERFEVGGRRVGELPDHVLPEVLTRAGKPTVVEIRLHRLDGRLDGGPDLAGRLGRQSVTAITQ